MFDPKHPRGIYPGSTALKPQYVLITENGEERTSNVTTERILKAVYEIDANGYVTLEKCLPVTIVEEASAFAISFYKDSRIAVYFRVGGTTVRMSDSGYTYVGAMEMMCNFFLSAEIPDVHDWTCEELMPARIQKSESNLTVDGEEFRYFGFADVMAALENVKDGKSTWLHHGISGEGEDGGYIHIFRNDAVNEQPAYKIEWVRWTHPEPTGYRAVISDFDSLRGWLSDFNLNRKYPEPTPEWESFDVTDYFKQLVLKFSEGNEG